MSSWLDGLDVVTDGHRGDLLAPLTGASIERSIDRGGVVTLSLELRDPDRKLVDGPLLARGARVDVDQGDGDLLAFEIVGVDKRGRHLTTTWQDAASLAMQRARHPEVTRPSATELNRFVGQLVREPAMTSPAFDPWNGRIGLVREPDPQLAEEDTDEQLARAGDDPDGEPESSWEALQRLAEACDPPRRRFSLGRIIVFASDGWLGDGRGAEAGGHQPHRWTEGRGGVDKIDYRWDVGKKADSATVDLWVPDIKRVTPSAPVNLDEPGDAASGVWLVEKMTWNPFSTKAQCTLTRPAELRDDGDDGLSLQQQIDKWNSLPDEERLRRGVPADLARRARAAGYVIFEDLSIGRPL